MNEQQNANGACGLAAPDVLSDPDPGRGSVVSCSRRKLELQQSDSFYLCYRGGSLWGVVSGVVVSGDLVCACVRCSRASNV